MTTTRIAKYALVFIGSLFLILIVYVVGDTAYKSVCITNISNDGFNGSGKTVSMPSRFYVNSCSDVVYYKHNSLGGTKWDTSLAVDELQVMSQSIARDNDEIYLDYKKIKIDQSLLPLVPSLELVYCQAVHDDFFVTRDKIYTIENRRTEPKLVESTDTETHKKCNFIQSSNLL